MDTDYFWEHRPSSFLVVPGGELTAVYFENLDLTTDMEILIPMAQRVLLCLRPDRSMDTETTHSFDSGPLGYQCRFLQQAMAEHKSYQDPSLSLSDFAKLVNLSQRTITDAINTCLGQNFHTFVNSYRIEAVKEALDNPDNHDKTILEIALAQGFNSKSTFNSVFKTIVGVTPSQYRSGLEKHYR